MNRKKAQNIVEQLRQTFPEAKCELDHKNAYELLIATMLSAQCTDVRVNKTTKTLFPKYPTPKDLANASQEEVEDSIREVGLFHSKAKNIRQTARILVEQYDSEVPGTMQELTKLPGVGRKTANVVLSNAFNVPSIAVDTHVFRVSHRLGLSKSTTPESCEKDLQKILKKEVWSEAHHLFIFLGRYICKARKPQCKECSLLDLCEYSDKNLA